MKVKGGEVENEFWELTMSKALRTECEDHKEFEERKKGKISAARFSVGRSGELDLWSRPQHGLLYHVYGN